MKEFLFCDPAVMVIKNRYDIVVNTLEEGVCYVKVGRKTFYASESGIMPSVTLVHKFSVPQKLLDEKKSYTVYYKRVYNRKENFPEVGRLQKVTYSFRPIEKTDDIRVFYAADIHAYWDEAYGCATGCGPLDLYIVNGDFGESSSYEKLRLFNKLIGDVTKGEIPSLVGRGNHDTRGKLAEKVTDYMACENGKAYFDFTVGPIGGLVLDCGEDKYDNHPEYRSLNFFEQYRKDELKFLKKLKPSDKPFRFAVCHVPFMSSYSMCGQFDIMPDLYAKWGKEVDRLNLEFMICGHHHVTEYYPSGHVSDKFPHSYPVVLGSALKKDPFTLVGTLIRLKRDGSEMAYYNQKGECLQSFTVKEGY